MLWLGLVMLATAPAFGQSARPSQGYYPIDQNLPPGTAANWSAILGRGVPPYFQPIRIELPSTGTVTVYSGGSHASSAQPVPAQAGFLVGRSYRIKISDMPEFPGVELYPTIEVLDRLHPPAGKKQQFPIVLQITRQEIEFAITDRLVSKVVYLERPQTALPRPLDRSARVEEMKADENLLAEADRMGRPMLLVRLGGRTPTTQEAAFFGRGFPVEVLKKR